MRSVVVVLVPLTLVLAVFAEDQSGLSLPIKAEVFQQQIHRRYTEADGLPSRVVEKIGHTKTGDVFAQTAAGPVQFLDGTWGAATNEAVADLFALPPYYEALADAGVSKEDLRGVAEWGDETVVAAAQGLYVDSGRGDWQLLFPREGEVRWAPVDLRAVLFDAKGRLWFACPQGVGCRAVNGTWTLFTGEDGLPFNDFTSMAAGPDGIWLGTTNGAIHFSDQPDETEGLGPEGTQNSLRPPASPSSGPQQIFPRRRVSERALKQIGYEDRTLAESGHWEFRQGRRWLLDNHIYDVTVTDDGSAWFATTEGVSCIALESMTLAEKATRFETQIDQYHRRTRMGYVSGAQLPQPGLKEGGTAVATDNDGHYTGIYLAATSFGYGATKDPVLKEKARKAFEALALLSKVTEGGTHPAPKGFIARAVEPTAGPDPNLDLNPSTDEKRRAERDQLWKIMDPRWPVDETGEWYWKCDSSSDELDGHYFGYGAYFDNACETEAERDQVREVVKRVTDHLIDNNYNQVDHDGTPTRWGHFSPDDLNKNEDWWFERGLNSQSILTFLQVAFHITGEQRYRDEMMRLAFKEGYAMNMMTSPKIQFGPGSLGQGDDNMAFMNYYHLIRYETDPTLLSMFQNSIYWYWSIEKYERNPYFNFIYAACCEGKSRTDQWGTVDLSPPAEYMALGVDTLKRYPLDLIDYGLSNAHRIDVTRLGEHTQGDSGRNLNQGYGHDGLVFPIDEQHALIWGEDPWYLHHEGNESRLRDPVPYLVAYYMGLLHGFIVE